MVGRCQAFPGGAIALSFTAMDESLARVALDRAEAVGAPDGERVAAEHRGRRVGQGERPGFAEPLDDAVGRGRGDRDLPWRRASDDNQHQSQTHQPNGASTPGVLTGSSLDA